MIDTLLAQLPRARARGFGAELGVERGRYALSTLHRPSNVDDADMLAAALDALARVAGDMPVVLPVHPRTRLRAEGFGLQEQLARLTVMEPLGYTEMLSLVDGAAGVLTDSGGLQEETSALGVPCVTMRENTERPITVELGTSRLVGNDSRGLQAAFEDVIQQRWPAGRDIPLWDGKAGDRVAAELSAWLVRRSHGVELVAR